MLFLKSLVKNYQAPDRSCQGSAQSADLHAFDSNKRYIFHSGVREKELFHHPLNKGCCKQALIFIIVIAVVTPGQSHAQETLSDSLRISEFPTYETFMPGEIIKYGVQTGFVFTRDLDTGMDCGGRISQNFFHPFFKLNSQAHFWAASEKNLDLGVAGIEESITYQIPIYKKITGYAGFALGYISILEEKRIFTEGKYEEVDTRTNHFEPFVIFGIEYFLEKSRSIFIESKFGSTSISRELHLLIGLNFYRKEIPETSSSSMAPGP